MDLNGSNGSKLILANLRSCCEVGIKDFFDLVSHKEYLYSATILTHIYYKCLVGFFFKFSGYIFLL